MHVSQGLLLVLTLGATLFGAAPALGQSAPAGSALPPLSEAKDKLKPGSWVRYSITNLRSGQSSEVSLLALNYEGKGQWIEVALLGKGGRALVYKSLMVPDEKRGARPAKMIVQPPGQRPMIVPTDADSKGSPLNQADYQKGKLLARGMLKVRGGAFRGRRVRTVYKGTVYEAWLTEGEGPAWPLLRVASKTIVLELVAFGRQGTSKVVGKPVRVDKGMLQRLGLGN